MTFNQRTVVGFLVPAYQRRAQIMAETLACGWAHPSSTRVGSEPRRKAFQMLPDGLRMLVQAFRRSR